MSREGILCGGLVSLGLVGHVFRLVRRFGTRRRSSLLNRASSRSLASIPFPFFHLGGSCYLRFRVRTDWQARKACFGPNRNRVSPFPVGYGSIAGPVLASAVVSSFVEVPPIYSSRRSGVDWWVRVSCLRLTLNNSRRPSICEYAAFLIFS